MFCQFCGKDIAEGEVCGCEKEREVLNESTENAEITEKKKPDTMLIAAAVAFVAVIVLVVILIASIGGGYKKPVKDFVKALNKCDGTLMVDTVFTDKMIRYMEKEENMDYDDLCDEFDDLLDNMMDELEDEYGDDVKITLKIEDKDKLDEDDIEEIEDYYKEEDIRITIKKAYELECNLAVEGEDDDDDEDFDIIVIKVKDEGWKLCLSSMEDILG